MKEFKDGHIILISTSPETSLLLVVLRILILLAVLYSKMFCLIAVDSVKTCYSAVYRTV